MNLSDFYFIKTATLEALNKKRYWQILKRLYGGTEAAVERLKSMPDKFRGVYHGTSKENVKKILKEGLKPGSRNLYGEGAYLGSGNVAATYAGRGGRGSLGTRGLRKLKRPIARRFGVGFKSQKLVGDKKKFGKKPSFLKGMFKNIYKGAVGGSWTPIRNLRPGKNKIDGNKLRNRLSRLRGQAIRLKRPSELSKGQVYPDVSGINRHQVDSRRGHEHINKLINSGNPSEIGRFMAYGQHKGFMRMPSQLSFDQGIPGSLLKRV